MIRLAQKSCLLSISEIWILSHVKGTAYGQTEGSKRTSKRGVSFYTNPYCILCEIPLLEASGEGTEGSANYSIPGRTCPFENEQP